MINIVRADNKTFEIERHNEDNELIIDKAEELVITFKKNCFTSDILFQKKLSDNSITFADGVYTFEIKSEDTEKLNYGTYCFDVVVYENDKKRTILLDELKVTAHCNFNEGEIK